MNRRSFLFGATVAPSTLIGGKANVQTFSINRQKNGKWSDGPLIKFEANSSEDALQKMYAMSDADPDAYYLLRPATKDGFIEATIGIGRGGKNV